MRNLRKLLVRGYRYSSTGPLRRVMELATHAASHRTTGSRVRDALVALLHRAVPTAVSTSHKAQRSCPLGLQQHGVYHAPPPWTKPHQPNGTVNPFATALCRNTYICTLLLLQADCPEIGNAAPKGLRRSMGAPSTLAGMREPVCCPVLQGYSPKQAPKQNCSARKEERRGLFLCTSICIGVVRYLFWLRGLPPCC